MGGVRVLGCGNVIRRLLGKAVVQLVQEETKQAVGESQLGLQRDGTGKLHREMAMYMGVNEGKFIVSIDMADAFMNLEKPKVVERVSKHMPKMTQITKNWIGNPVSHVIQGEIVEQIRGLDQGCPLSPLYYTIASIESNEATEKTMKDEDETARVRAYLDDTYLFGNAEASNAGYERAKEEARKLGLKLNLDKTKVWGPNASTEDIANLAPELRDKLVPTLFAVGATVPYAKHDRTTDVATTQTQQATSASGKPRESSRGKRKELGGESQGTSATAESGGGGDSRPDGNRHTCSRRRKPEGR